MINPKDFPPALAAMHTMPPGDPATTRPYPVEFTGGLTDPRPDGTRDAVIGFSDGTVTTQIRVPAEIVERLGTLLGQVCASLAARRDADAGPQLLRPTGSGALFLPSGVHLNGRDPNGGPGHG